MVGEESAGNADQLGDEDRAFLRALLGYSSAPELIPIVVFLLYLLPVMLLFLATRGFLVKGMTGTTKGL